MADDAIHAVRVCRKCGVEKPADLVHFPPVGKSIRPQCRPCWREHERTYFWANRDAKRQAAKRRWAKADKVAERTKLQAWKAANPEKAKAIEAARIERIKSDPELKAKAAARMKRWRDANPDKDAEARRRRLETDPGATARYSRAYAERHPDRRREKGRAWRAKNPAKVIAYSEKRRERVRDADGEITEQVVLDLIAASGMRCFYCDKAITSFHIDHFVPVSRGGTNLIENLRVACGPCNRRKSNKFPWEWKPERFAPPD